MTCQEKKARRMRKAETLLLGEVFQTFDSFSQSLLSLAELPPTQGLKLGAFSRLKSGESLCFCLTGQAPSTFSFTMFLPFSKGSPLLNDRI
jgi:hypothetical protein